ncbi:FIST N-terminal domain-containing protein [Methylococcus sp. EFPC2]|uniref:FIST signal transduction protein n=1 Tax=Methylococcus sp. EFPC2 TaxID=2812648 RepID=UPI0019685864|nr:FIST N-terminal domain-containing protein [Methylococcus sp. EFPC2]QSA98415.1 FIST C-terminal domain-containing protein [Methylococcus sp. EFPC2]
MTSFIQAHAGHADWRIALDRCWSRIRQQLEQCQQAKPTLGWCYLTDHYAQAAGAILDALRERAPETHWVGTVGIGVAAGSVEYIDEPAMVLMLGCLPTENFRVFAGPQALDAATPGCEAFTALVHANGATEDLPRQLRQLSGRTTTGYLFGGLSSARNQTLHFADDILVGGLSGVAFSPEVPLLSRVTQGCRPIGPQRTITRAEGNVLVSLDGKRALDCVLEDLDLPHDVADEPLRRMLAATLAGLIATDEDVPAQPGLFGTNTEVRHLIGVGRDSGVLVVADHVKPGMRLAFCQRNAEAAKHDLLRIVREIRGACDAKQRIDGALYISCSGRGGPHFGEPHAEFHLVNRELGENVPLVGFFAGGEIARHHLYGYTGVLTVFTSPL